MLKNLNGVFVYLTLSTTIAIIVINICYIHPSMNKTVMTTNVTLSFVDEGDKHLNGSAGGNNNLTSYDPEYAALKRVERFYKRCRHLGFLRINQTLTAKHKHGIVSEKLKTIIYVNYKVGSTTWSNVLANNARYMNSTNDTCPEPEIDNIYQGHVQGHYGLRGMSKYSKEQLVTYFSVLTVRHPLSRIESAFTEKFTQLNRSYCKHTGKRITLRYRKSTDKVKSELKRIKTCITFEEFLQFLSGKTFDNNPHWIPMVNKPHDTCNTKFDFIAKTETQTEDMNYIIDNRLSGKCKSLHRKQSRSQTETNVLPLFSALTDPEYYIHRLMTRYHNDMVLFGYRYEVTSDGKVLALCDEYTNSKCL